MFSTMNETYLPSDHMTPLLPPLHEENQTVDEIQSSLQDEVSYTPEEEGTNDWTLCEANFCGKTFDHCRTGHSFCHCHAQCNYKNFYNPRNCQICMAILDTLPKAKDKKQALQPLTAWAKDFAKNTVGRPSGYHYFWNHDDSVTMDISSTKPSGEMWEASTSEIEELLYEPVAGPSTDSYHSSSTLGDDLSPESMFSSSQFICSSFSDSSEESSSSSEYSWAEAVSELGPVLCQSDTSGSLTVSPELDCTKTSSSKPAMKISQHTFNTPEIVTINVDVPKSIPSLQAKSSNTTKVTRPSNLSYSAQKPCQISSCRAGQTPSTLTLYPATHYKQACNANLVFNNKVPVTIQAEVHQPPFKKEEGSLSFKYRDFVANAGHLKFVGQTLVNLTGKFHSKVSNLDILGWSEASEVMIFIPEDSHLFPFPKTFDFFLLVGKFTPEAANDQLKTSYTPLDTEILDLEWTARQTMFGSLSILGIIEGLTATDKEKSWSKALQRLAKLQLQRLVEAIGTFLKARLALRRAALPGCSLDNPYVHSLLSSTPWSVGPFGAHEVSELHLRSAKLNQAVASLLQLPPSASDL
ncbi:uncharacterized protein LOC135217321 [Macrobrachium nipponense]|uniref:uncharacterized protein LOC135217321 n=1 Tax=Macrobrachium nipponense TaxID=159736 RepID=UPI0030C82397